MSDDNIALTILTPTYNRASYLQVLYQSLCRQTCRDFQWLVVDDGSSDATEALMQGFIAETKIRIDYKRKVNGGKHTALNYSQPYIKGRYLVIVDSDDYLTDDAVDRILTKWAKYAADETIAGITFQRGGADNLPFDPSIASEFTSTLVAEMNRGMHGDHCEVVRTDLFCSFRFPEFSDERFIAEGAMWYSITRGYRIVYSDEIVYIAKYLLGGLTKSGRALHIQNPKGCMYHAAVLLTPDFCLKLRVKNALLYICYGYFAGVARPAMLRKLKSQKALVQLLWPLGYLLYRYWKAKYPLKK